MQIVTNYRRASFVFTRLLAAYQERRFPYTEENLARLPQRRIPMEFRGEANFYFYLCHFMRGRIKSDYAVWRMVEMRQKRPELFDPRHVMTLSPEEMEAALVSFFGPLPPSQRYGEAWYRNSQILAEWGGDVLAFFKGVDTPDELRKRVVNKKNYELPLKEQGVFMFQEKLCAMLAYFLMDAGLVPLLRISPPVDFHHLRVMLGTGMLVVGESFRRPRTLSLYGLRMAERYLAEHPEVHPVEFADLLWMLSGYGCVRAVSEPEPDWDAPKVQRRYAKSCGACPVERQCDSLVVASAYYRRGEEARAAREIHVIHRPTPKG